MSYLVEIKNAILRATNEYRWYAGLQQLNYADALGYLGQLHTNEMYRCGFFSHVNQQCSRVASLQDRVAYCGLANQYSGFGENLARFPPRHL